VYVTDVFCTASQPSFVSDIHLRLKEVVWRMACTHTQAHTQFGIKFYKKKPTTENITLTVHELSTQRNRSGGFDLLMSLDFRLANDFRTKNTNTSSIF
jgi:hypothetical protein